MEFQITIDKKDITFSNNFRWMLNYKNQFREDPADFLMECLSDIDEMDPEDKKYSAKLMKMTSKIGFIRLSNMAWAMAKAADKNVPPPPAWVDQFDDYPVMIFGMDILIAAINSVMGNDVTEDDPKNQEAPGEALNPANQ